MHVVILIEVQCLLLGAGNLVCLMNLLGFVLHPKGYLLLYGTLYYNTILFL